MDKITTYDRAMDLSAAMSAEPQVNDHTDYGYMVLPNNVKTCGLEDYMENPYRVREERTFTTESGFIGYLNEFKSSASRLFGKKSLDRYGHDSITCVVDYHKKDDSNAEADINPSWCDHKIHYALKNDEDWAIWKGINGDTLSQRKLLNFIMDYAASFCDEVGNVTPKAEIVEMAQNIKVINSSEFEGKAGHYDLSQAFQKSTKVTSNGQELPEVLHVRLSVYEDSQNYAVPFRITITTDGEPMFKIQLVRPHLIENQAFSDACERIAQGCDIPLFA